MTESKAKELLIEVKETYNFGGNISDALTMAIKALEKQISQPVNHDGYFGFHSYDCPTCKHDVTNISNFCPNCGQKIFYT